MRNNNYRKRHLFVWSALQFLNAVNIVAYYCPFAPMVSLVILLTVCHTILMTLVWRILYWINQESPIDISFYSHLLFA